MKKKSHEPRDGIFQRKDRKGFFISWVDASGKRRKRKTNATNITQAKTALAAELTRVEQAKALGFSPATKDSFAKLADRFIIYQRARLTPKAFERESGIIRIHLKPFFNCDAAAIRRLDVQRYVTSRSGKASPHSVAKELTILKHLLRMAVEWEILPISPADRVKAVPVPAGRVRYLQPTELKLLIDACPKWLQPIVVFALNTGARRGEIVKMRWADLDQNRLLLHKTKNGDNRTAYLNQAALAVILDQPRTSPRIFPNCTAGQITVAFRRVCKKIEIEDFRFHDLRHCAASWLRMSGADLHDVATLLGHRDLRMTARYSHLSNEHLTAVVGRLDKIFSPHSVPADQNLETENELSN